MAIGDTVLGIAVVGIGVYNVNHPIYDRRWFHRTFEGEEPLWKDAGRGSRIVRAWVSAMCIGCGAMLVFFGLRG